MKTTKKSDTTLHIAFIEAGWHADIVEKCRAGFLAEIANASAGGSAEVSLFKVPGSFDIPLMAKKLAETGRFEAVVAAGFVVDGGIYRHDFVAGTVIDALMRVQLDTGVPVISAVLTPHHFNEGAAHVAFFRDHFDIKGREAARAVLQIAANMREIAGISVDEALVAAE
ncbi:MAG: 6,7-dimethyl-8-ribityllumazine synthase [Rhizobiaceae bacterium]